jgi:hypothetical protein
MDDADADIEAIQYQVPRDDQDEEAEPDLGEAHDGVSDSDVLSVVARGT